jgi:hypothetical protein
MTFYLPGCSSALSQSDSPEPNLVVHVLVDDYSQVSAETLAKAEDRASMIFREAEVELIWVNQAQEIGQPKNQPLSQHSLDQIDYVLRILPHSRAKLNDNALGEALTCTPRESACFANVFYNRVQQRTDAEKVSLAQVLGHAMAHELGHLLLGSNSHSSRGIMRGTWSAADIRLVAKGDLLFTSEQTRAMRDNALVRLNPLEPNQAFGAASSQTDAAK